MRLVFPHGQAHGLRQPRSQREAGAGQGGPARWLDRQLLEGWWIGTHDSEGPDGPDYHGTGTRGFLEDALPRTIDGTGVRPLIRLVSPAETECFTVAARESFF